MAQISHSDEKLLQEHRRRDAERNSHILNIICPMDRKEFLMSLGGYFKLTKSPDEKQLKIQLIFKNKEDAAKAKETILSSNDEEIKLDPLASTLPANRINWSSLKIFGVPKEVDDGQITVAFPSSISIIRKSERRENLIWCNRKEYKKMLARDEVVVGYPSKEHCVKAFMARGDLVLGGEKVYVLFGQKNTKIPKNKRKKMREMRQKLKQQRKEQRKERKKGKKNSNTPGNKTRKKQMPGENGSKGNVLLNHSSAQAKGHRKEEKQIGQ